MWSDWVLTYRHPRPTILKSRTSTKEYNIIGCYNYSSPKLSSICSIRGFTKTEKVQQNIQNVWKYLLQILGSAFEQVLIFSLFDHSGSLCFRSASKIGEKEYFRKTIAPEIQHCQYREWEETLLYRLVKNKLF